MDNIFIRKVGTCASGENLYELINEYNGSTCGVVTAFTREDAIKKWESKLSEKASLNSPKYDLTDDGTGKKYDSGKSMVGTLCRVFPRALLAVGKCIEFGTHKYPQPDNWKLVEGAFTRYQDSLMRHYTKFLAGQERDNETNLLHLSHMAWNCLAILELYLMEHKDEYDNELFS